MDNTIVTWGEGPEAGRCFLGHTQDPLGTSSQPLAGAGGASRLQK